MQLRLLNKLLLSVGVYKYFYGSNLSMKLKISISAKRDGIN